MLQSGAFAEAGAGGITSGLASKSGGSVSHGVARRDYKLKEIDRLATVSLMPSSLLIGVKHRVALPLS